jgi:hypothetical protein
MPDKVDRLIRCPRCMGDGRHYPQLSTGSPHKLDDEPCPDCQGEGEANVDELLSIYMARAQGWKTRADQAEAILKRVARAKKEGLGELLQVSDDQRLHRVEKVARELVVEWEKFHEPSPSSFDRLRWALMGGDPDVDKCREGR